MFFSSKIAPPSIGSSHSTGPSRSMRVTIFFAASAYSGVDGYLCLKHAAEHTLHAVDFRRRDDFLCGIESAAFHAELDIHHIGERCGR